LGERHRERILGRQRACAGFLVVLVELCREVHGFADDRVFELRVVAHGAKDHGPDRSRRIDHDWMETGRVSVRVPAIDFGEGLIKRDGRVRCVGRRWPSDAERRNHTVAQDLVDRTAVILDDRDQPRLILRQKRHDLVRFEVVGERREAADIKDQNGAFASLAAPNADVVLGIPDAGRDARIEEPRQLARSAALRHSADQEPSRARDRQGQDYGDAQDRNNLLDLGADQDPIGGDLVNKVVGELPARSEPCAAAW
jgi:hypothetical protein